jgi:hypothetical protein
MEVAYKVEVREYAGTPDERISTFHIPAANEYEVYAKVNKYVVKEILSVAYAPEETERYRKEGIIK